MNRPTWIYDPARGAWIRPPRRRLVADVGATLAPYALMLALILAPFAHYLIGN